jgi:hypothetical protein
MLRSRPRLAARALAGALAALWVATALAAVAHGAREQHRFCDEHAAFEEVHAGNAVAVPDGAFAPSAPAEGDEHEACPFVAATAAEPSEATAPAAAASPDHAASAPPATTAGAHPIPLLALAPKHGPPAFLG